MKFNCYQVISSLTILDIIPSKGPTFRSDHLTTSLFYPQDQNIDSQVFLLIDSDKKTLTLHLKFPGDNCRTLPKSAWSEFSNPNYQPHALSTITQFGLIPPCQAESGRYTQKKTVVCIQKILPNRSTSALKNQKEPFLKPNLLIQRMQP